MAVLAGRNSAHALAMAGLRLFATSALLVAAFVLVAHHGQWASSAQLESKLSQPWISAHSGIGQLRTNGMEQEYSADKQAVEQAYDSAHAGDSAWGDAFERWDARRPSRKQREDAWAVAREVKQIALSSSREPSVAVSMGRPRLAIPNPAPLQGADIDFL